MPFSLPGAAPQGCQIRRGGDGSGLRLFDSYKPYLQYAHNNSDNFLTLIDNFTSRSDIDPKFHKATQISQLKKKKRKHENDSGFRGY